MSVLGANQVALLPQIKRLKEKKLLVREDDICRLSPLGKAIAGRIEPVIGSMSLFSNNPDYWKGHLLEAIPPYLLETIHKLEPCFFRTLDNAHFFEPNREVVENLEKSNSIKGLTSVFHPFYPEMFLDFAEKGAEVLLIVTEDIFERVREEYAPQLEKFLKLEKTRFYICKKEIQLVSVVTDRFLSFSLFYPEGILDHRKEVLSFGPGGLKWGEELFEHFRLISEEITEI
ncbi:MAG: winged helix-turn-helix domain-containing protein [Methanosarcinaceae archaeon]|nr:winged helix-turn-helix domain-containing protein [Methanosarcinaceae archaeon]